MITSDELRKLLRYEPETGRFYWLKSGKEAGCKRRDGYHIMRIKQKNYLRHRLAWLYTVGEWPKLNIDHKNCIRGDDRFENLREANQCQNVANSSKRMRNKSGFKGVYWAKNERKWVASIKADRKKHSLGYFNNVEEAHEAYKAAAKRLHGEFARTD